MFINIQVQLCSKSKCHPITMYLLIMSLVTKENQFYISFLTQATNVYMRSIYNVSDMVLMVEKTSATHKKVLAQS